MKRKAVLFLSAVMAASSLPMTAYAANFKDINDVPWNGAQTVINQVADLGLLGGYEDNTFRARNNVTYCEAMQMVYKVMTKTGAAEPIDAVDAYSYMAILNTYKVPAWAQMAVAYGLHNNIIDMQMVATKFVDGNQHATREDVAKMFGNAMAKFYDKERNTPDALTFADYWAISQEVLPQVDILKRLGIISGDSSNCFQPKRNINRAEMAVMLNKTNGVLTEGVSISGEITELIINEDKYYYIEVTLDNGVKEDIYAEEGSFPVYAGNTTKIVPLTDLSEGDKVVLVRGGSTVVALRQMDGVAAQEKYDATGYITSYDAKERELVVDNENTGEREKYTLASDTKIRVENKTTTTNELEELLGENYTRYAYAGMTFDAVREKVGGSYKDVLYLKELDVTFVDEYTVVGEVKNFGTNSIRLSPAGGGTQKDYIYATDCAYYIGDSKASYSELEELADAGTVYAKIEVNSKGHVTKISMSEDDFTAATKIDKTETYEVRSLSDKKLTLELRDERIEYAFGSKNPLDNITFYEGVKDGNEWDFEKLKDVDKAAARVEAWENDDKDVYAKVTFNKGGKLSEVYLATAKNAWKNSTEFQTEKQGTVASLVDDVLKFENSTQKYTLLDKYENGDFYISGPTAETSKVVLERLANDDDIELYAEIKANGSGEIIELNAEVKAAKGELVEYKPEEYIKIKTDNGSEFKFNVTTEPSTDDEEEYTWKDFKGTKYIGSEIDLDFNGNGS